MQTAAQPASATLAGRPSDLIFRGIVIPGNRIGRTIGFPTANVAAAHATPDCYGIYTTTIVLDGGRALKGVSNLGVKPTIGSHEPLLEVHIFDFAEDIYGRSITALLHERLRPERKFESVAALQAQLAIDVQLGRTLLAAPLPVDVERTPS